MTNFNDILGKYIDMDKVRSEARAILGPELHSRELLLALAIRELALQIEDLKTQLNQGKLLNGAPLVIEDLVIPDMHEVPGLAEAPIKLHKDLVKK